MRRLNGERVYRSIDKYFQVGVYKEYAAVNAATEDARAKAKAEKKIGSREEFRAAILRAREAKEKENIEK
jgi:hypothetical protein